MQVELATSDIITGLLIALVLALIGYVRRTSLKLKHMIEELHDWHKPEPDGTFKWHKTVDLGSMVGRIISCTENQTELLRIMHLNLKETRRLCQRTEELVIGYLTEQKNRRDKDES